MPNIQRQFTRASSRNCAARWHRRRKESIVRRNQSICIFMGIALCIMGTGCATRPPYQMYSGDRLPQQDVAYIVTRHGYITADSIDGRPPYPNLGKAFLRGGLIGVFVTRAKVDTSVAAVLPGDLNIALSFYKSMGYSGNMHLYLASVAPRILTLKAEAGHKYRVNGDQVGERGWTAYIEDVSTSTPSLVTPAGGRLEFEHELQRVMSSGDIKADEVTITYPDGTTRTISPPTK